LGKYVKFSVKVTHPRQIPYLVGQAVKFSLAGRPGPVYIDVPGDVLTAEITENIPSLPNFSNNLPKCIADEEGLNLACKLI
jgi:thiamine pyrophosphate-dependent acetolactate synthase large subunit-like protein